MKRILFSKTGYSLIRSMLFKIDPEITHELVMSSLEKISPLIKPSLANKNIDFMRLKIPHHIGLAAGFDKNGEYIDLLFKLGFSFVEVGTVTPKAQAGNPKPRIFRVPNHESLVNSMGFPNHGVAQIKSNLKKRKTNGIVGVNLGKNKSTPLNKSHEDYILCLKSLYRYADYFVINVSSPNTPNLRKLQNASAFLSLIEKITSARNELYCKNHIYRPIAYKISPDLNDYELRTLLDICLEKKIDGIISSNTTTRRPSNINDLPQGGISGKLLKEKSEEQLQQIIYHLDNKIPVASVGGIQNKKDAKTRLALGAQALQIYTGFIYKGPKLIEELSSLS